MPHRRRTPGSPQLPVEAFELMLTQSESDVLLLYDSCYNASTHFNCGNSSLEIIAASGFEDEAQDHRNFSFTRALVQILEKSTAPMSTAELHAKIFKRMAVMSSDGWDEGGRTTRRNTPIHVVCSKASRNQRILLCPQSIPELHSEFPSKNWQFKAVTQAQNPSISSDLQQGQPDSREPAEQHKGLLTIRLENGRENDKSIDTKEWLEWLRDCPPEARNISVGAIFRCD